MRCADRRSDSIPESGPELRLCSPLLKPSLDIELLPLTLEAAHCALGETESLSRTTSTQVPGDWPPEHLGPHVLDKLKVDLDPDQEPPVFGLYFIRCRHGEDPWQLGGVAGFNGEPDSSGRVDIGYSVVPSLQGRGLATAAVRCLVGKAREHGCSRVVAHTLADDDGPIDLLERQGFEDSGRVSGPGIRRYVLRFDSAE